MLAAPLPKRRKTSGPALAKRAVQVEDIALERAHSEFRLRLAWEDIIKRYSDPNLTTDEINLDTGAVLVDNGHLKGMKEDKENVWRPEGKEKEAVEVPVEFREVREAVRMKEMEIRMCKACEELDELEGVECTHLDGAAAGTVEHSEPTPAKTPKPKQLPVKAPQSAPQLARPRASPDIIWTDAPILQRDLIWHSEDDPIPNFRREISSTTKLLANIIEPGLGVEDEEEDEEDEDDSEQESEISWKYSNPMVLITANPQLNLSEYSTISPFSSPKKDLVVRETVAASTKTRTTVQGVARSPSPMVTPAAEPTPSLIVPAATITTNPRQHDHDNSPRATPSPTDSTSNSILALAENYLPSPLALHLADEIFESSEEAHRPRTPPPPTTQTLKHPDLMTPLRSPSIKNTYSKKPKWQQAQSSPVQTAGEDWWRRMSSPRLASPELDSPVFSQQNSSAKSARTVRCASPELAPLPPMPVRSSPPPLAKEQEALNTPLATSPAHELPELPIENVKTPFKTPFKKPAMKPRTPLTRIKRENSTAPRSVPRPQQKKIVEAEKRRWSLLDLASDDIMIGAEEDDGFAIKRKGKRKSESVERVVQEVKVVKKEETPFSGKDGRCGEEGYSCGRRFCFRCL